MTAMKNSGFELITEGSISFLRCRPLLEAGFFNAFSTRKSGMSPMPKADLNLSYREESPGIVDENRRRFLSAIKIRKPLVTCVQTHSDLIADVEETALKEPDADALVSQSAN